MSSHSESRTRPDEDTVDLRVDRVACTGHGVCAGVLPRNIELDEWGYPIVRDSSVDPAKAATAIRLCPARALYRA
ncbi:MAG: ferredoxin [Intrasporangium sp.]|uniref:ferredoxin n=1 Tax=Intrasporangium sp. TaxID=1925024 RepID=UPI003F7E238E